MQVFDLLVSALGMMIGAVMLTLNIVLGLFSDQMQVTTPTSAPTALATTTPPSSSTVATTSLPEVVTPAPSPAKKATPLVAPPTKQTTAPPVVLQTKSPDEVNTQTRTALVNILCTTKAGGYLHPISGSGVMVSSAGVVLTNAHVAQYFLLRDFPTPNNIDCVIRTGSPAQATYRADLLYLPPAWIEANANQITAIHATGTGENDYAFLRITSTVRGTSLPAILPFIHMTLDWPKKNDPVFLAAYPASFLDGSAIEANLNAISAFSSIENIYTFNKETVDVVSLGGNPVSQSGSSGGAAVRRQDGALFGLIATASPGETTAARNLSAITIDYIDRSLKNQGQGGIATLLLSDITKKAAEYAANTAPGLTQKLITALNATSTPTHQ